MLVLALHRRCSRTVFDGRAMTAMTGMDTELASRASPAKLLLVDDHRPNLLALEAVFAPLGCEIVLAESGEEALKAVLHDEFAAILLDVQMPGLDGFQTASLIRGRPRSRHVPIIFLTAVSREKEFVFRGYEHGAVDYLVKPFHPDILRSKVSVFVELWARREQIRLQGEELLRHEREALQRASSLRYQQLVDVMPQGVWAARTDGTVYLVNRTWTDYTGLDAEATTKGFLEAVHEEDRSLAAERWAAARDGHDPFSVEVRLKRASDGVHHWFLVRTVPERSPQGELVGFIGTATDIDEQRRDREVLAAAVQAKDDFLAAASHELRTPLAAAKAQVQLSLRRVEPASGEPLVRSLKMVAAQIDRMTRLVEDLLDISRLRTGRLSLQLTDFDLAERLRVEVDRMQALTTAHAIELETEGDLTICADRDRIDQVLINLLTNAARYSPGGGPILVRARNGDEQIEVSVADRGVGIPPDKQAKIFERFGRAHGTRYGGLGLGLTIAQGIVEQHGGRIWVESTGVPGEGTIFRFTIPRGAVVRASCV